jgi:hypothetical protein
MHNNISTEINERVTSKFDYEVEQVPLLTPDGQSTRFFGTRRKDTGEVFATVTDQYEILQNNTLFSTAERLFGKKGMDGFKRRTVVTHGGARARAIYDFPTIGGKIGKDDVHFRLTAQNSFDGSLRASFAVGLFRLICSNGAAVPVNALNLTKKHTSSLDGEFVGRALDNAVQSFHDALPAFHRMTEIAVSQKDGKRLLLNLADRKVLSERMAEKVVSVWESPTYHEDRERNLWNLYNATTQHLTHEVAGRADKPRFELAERVNNAVMTQFVTAARSGSIDHLLVKFN